MRTVHKYYIGFQKNKFGKFEIETSNCFGKPVLVGVQGDVACLWLEEPRAERKEYLRTFYVVGTGQEIPESKTGPLEWMGSWQHDQFVWHLYG